MQTDPHGRDVRSRRLFLATVAQGMAAAALPGIVLGADAPGQTNGGLSLPVFREHRVPRGNHTLYAREWAGSGPTYILLHGFPDNLHIYDWLAPILAAAGKHVVSFDFMGFGNSDKPSDVKLNFAQQMDDLRTIANALGHEKVIPVGHDGGGPTAINFALANSGKVSSLVVLNTFYGDSPGLAFPELIELCADPQLQELALDVLNDPGRLKWILEFQMKQFLRGATQQQKDLFARNTRPIFDGNFAGGAGPAFVQMTADIRPQVALDNARKKELARFTPKVNVIWGTQDRYLARSVADDIAKRFRHGKVFPVDAGHWLQIEAAQEVAHLMLENA